MCLHACCEILLTQTAQLCHRIALVVSRRKKKTQVTECPKYTVLFFHQYAINSWSSPAEVWNNKKAGLDK